MPAKKEDLPSTLERSPDKVQRTYEKTLDSAQEQYGSESRAHRTAWSAVKHIAEKRGDHWELKDEYGPSDPQAAQGGAGAVEDPKPTHGGVDVQGNSKQELADRARSLGIDVKTRWTKLELGQKIAQRQAYLDRRRREGKD